MEPYYLGEGMELPDHGMRWPCASAALDDTLAERDALKAEVERLERRYGDLTDKIGLTQVERDALAKEVERLKTERDGIAAECAAICEAEAERLAATDDRGEIWKDGKAMAWWSAYEAGYATGLAAGRLAEREAVVEWLAQVRRDWNEDEQHQKAFAADYAQWQIHRGVHLQPTPGKGEP